MSGKPALVTDFQNKTEKETAPLPYSLSALQIDAARMYGMSAQQVLDICQRLYETHKAITYPRSDCRYLPEEHFVDREKILWRFLIIASNINPLSQDLIRHKKIVAGMTNRWKRTTLLFRLPNRICV